MDNTEQQELTEEAARLEKEAAEETLRQLRVAHGLPADGFPNAILIPLRAKYRNPGQ